MTGDRKPHTGAAARPQSREACSCSVSTNCPLCPKRLMELMAARRKEMVSPPMLTCVVDCLSGNTAVKRTITSLLLPPLAICRAAGSEDERFRGNTWAGRRRPPVVRSATSCVPPATARCSARRARRAGWSTAILAAGEHGWGLQKRPTRAVSRGGHLSPSLETDFIFYYLCYDDTASLNRGGRTLR